MFIYFIKLVKLGKSCEIVIYNEKKVDDNLTSKIILLGYINFGV